jgi:hypothetical protein
MDKTVANVVSRFKKAVDEQHEHHEHGVHEQHADWEMTIRDPDGDEKIQIGPGGQQAQMQEEAVAPPGWEGTVKHMKKHKEIDNPWALAWYMKNKGAEPHHASDAKYLLAANSAFKRHEAKKNGK